MNLRRTLAALALLSLPSLASAQTPAPAPALYGTVDEGVYRVMVGDRRIGTERFLFAIHFDSLYINSDYAQPLRGGDTLRKSQVLVVRHFDNDLIFYRSTLQVPGQPEVIRGLGVGDTVVTTYRESGLGGQGYTLLKPGGRLFAIESNAYALFDLLFRELATRRGWETRPVQLLTLGAHDTIVTSTARALGTQTVTWGGQTVQARKYSLTDGQVEFFAWIGPQGYMLRLEQPVMGLIVEREPPKRAPAKKAAATKPAAPKAPGAKASSR